MTKDELRRLALAKGAQVKIGDQVINSTRTKVDVGARPPPVKVAPPPPPPPAPKVDVTAAAVMSQTTTLARLFEDLREEVRATKAAGPITEWEFNVVRDRSGLIQKITAKAQGPAVH